MLGNMSGPTLLVILFIILLLFGAPKLPALAKSLGQSMRILKKEVVSKDEGEDAPAAAPVTPAAAAPAAVSAEDELAKAKAEAEAAKAEAEALRAAAEKRAVEGENS